MGCVVGGCVGDEVRLVGDRRKRRREEKTRRSGR